MCHYDIIIIIRSESRSTCDRWTHWYCVMHEITLKGTVHSICPFKLLHSTFPNHEVPSTHNFSKNLNPNNKPQGSITLQINEEVMNEKTHEERVWRNRRCLVWCSWRNHVMMMMQLLAYSSFIWAFIESLLVLRGSRTAWGQTLPHTLIKPTENLLMNTLNTNTRLNLSWGGFSSSWSTGC